MSGFLGVGGLGKRFGVGSVESVELEEEEEKRKKKIEKGGK